MPQQQAGYTDAILSLSPTSQHLAKREETIYGLRPAQRGLPTRRSGQAQPDGSRL